MEIKERKKRSSQTNSYPFPSAVALPEQMEEGKKYPLLIFLHGSDERGDDVSLLCLHGPLKYVKAGESYPFIVAAPQCPEGNYWTAYIESLNAYLDQLMEEYPVDPDRVYLTGLSMGGIAAWQWTQANPERFAAVVPVCGIGIAWYAYKMKEVPVWAFHGEEDDCIPCYETVNMVKALRAAGGEPKMTLYPGVGHNSWEFAYREPELVPWLMAQTRKK